MDCWWPKTQFQVIEVDHLSPALLLGFPLLLSAIGNIRKSFHNLPRTTPRLKEFLPPCHGSVSMSDLVSYMKPLTMALLCPLEVPSHCVLCFLQLLLLLNNIIRIALPPLWSSDISSFRTASRGHIASLPNIRWY